MQCEQILGTVKSGRYTSPQRCNEMAARGRLCPYHALKGIEVLSDRLRPHRELVDAIPMPGFEALKDLARRLSRGSDYR